MNISQPSIYGIMNGSQLKENDKVSISVGPTSHNKEQPTLASGCECCLACNCDWRETTIVAAWRNNPGLSPWTRTPSTLTASCEPPGTLILSPVTRGCGEMFSCTQKRLHCSKIHKYLSFCVSTTKFGGTAANKFN